MQVVYLEGLNGCLVLVVTSLPKSLPHSINALDDEPTFLQVDLCQFAVEEPESKAPIPSSDSTSTSPTCTTMAPPSKAESQVSMTMEVSELLLQAVLGHLQSSIGEFHPKRTSDLQPWVPHPLLGQKIPPNLWTTLLRHHHGQTCQMMQSQVIRPLRRFMLPPPPPDKTLGPGTSTLPKDVIQLQKEANRALGCLLVTISFLDDHWRKQVSYFEMALHQNESETTEAIKEAKILCDSTIREAKTH